MNRPLPPPPWRAAPDTPRPPSLGALLLACALFGGQAGAQSAAPAAGAGQSAPPVHIAHERLSEEQIDVVELNRPALPGKSFAAATIIDAPAQKLCAIVQDYPAYASYMPNTKSAQVVAANEQNVLVDMTLELPLGKIKRYRLQLDAKQRGATCQLNWKLVPGELKIEDTIADTTGYWMFTPLPANPAKSVVEYVVYADPGPVPYGLGWIVDIMSKKSLPRTLEALRGQAKKL